MATFSAQAQRSELVDFPTSDLDMIAVMQSMAPQHKQQQVSEAERFHILLFLFVAVSTLGGRQAGFPRKHGRAKARILGGVWGVGCGMWGVGRGLWGVRCRLWGVG